MTSTRTFSPARLALALTALLATDLLLPPGSILGPAPAEAIVGRPMTPVSVAGVARRTTRRTVVATTAVATTAVVAAPPPQTCTTQYDAYGRQVTTCY